MTEPIKPLNWDGFTEEALCEGDAWFHDAWRVARTFLVTDDTTVDQDWIDDQILEALQTAKVRVFARHPQTGSKHPVEARHWKTLSASLVGHWAKVPTHYADDFGAFVHRRLRVDGQDFLAWLRAAAMENGGDLSETTFPHFEHIEPPKARFPPQEKTHTHSPVVSSDVPEGHLSVDVLFQTALLRVFPELDQIPNWPDTYDDNGFVTSASPPDDLFSSWRARSALPGSLSDLEKHHWHLMITLAVARYMNEARQRDGIKVFYWSRTDQKAFEVPDDALRPTLDAFHEAAPWDGGKIHAFFWDSDHANLDGAAVFIAEDKQDRFWRAFEDVIGESEHIPPKDDGAREKPQLKNAIAAAKALYKNGKRPNGTSQEAAHAAMNAWLKDLGKPNVSQTTALRALGERK